MVREPILKQDVINVIERKGGKGIPLFLSKFWGMGLEEKYGNALSQMSANYADDIIGLWYRPPGWDMSTTQNPSYRWGYRPSYEGAKRENTALAVLPEWEELDAFLEDFPDPNEPGTFDGLEAQVKAAGGRYILGCWWYLFHEALWNIRGMENLMVDYYENMDRLKIVGLRLLEYYKVIIDRYAALGVNGIFSSDDLGHQTGPMMSPVIFKELYLPLYAELISYVHGKGMHMFLHSCGDNTKLMEYLIEAGLDVFHPVQRGCMDEVETVNKFGDRISFLVGVDIQHILPEGSVSDVRQYIKELKKIFHKPEGGMLLGMGNGVLPDTPLENIEAALEEMSKD